MKRLTEQEKKQIEKYKKKVHTQYPGAYLQAVGSYYTIVQEQQNSFALLDVLSEFCFMPQKDPVKAWELAQTAAKTNQNLNRTHPLRIEGMELEDKIVRMEARRIKLEEDRIARKKKERNIY